jgi:SAM-dependent methyltransferase
VVATTGVGGAVGGGDGPAVVPDREEVRVAHVLAGQQHSDHYLWPLADPAGKSVLVVGCGAGTDVLWCLRHGAGEVVGIDLLAQGRETLEAAAGELGVDPARARLEKMSIEEAPGRLGRRFDLVLSNNVFEHVGDLAAAFAACARLVEPGSGRVAIFSSPLYWSSEGSHLPLAPWEHLWGDAESVRRRLLAGGALRQGHPLEVLDLADYLDREISLNRARLADFLAAIGGSGLVLLHVGILPDPRAGEIADRLAALRKRPTGGEALPAPLDLALAGVGIELALPAASAPDALVPRSTAEARLAAERAEHGGEVELRRMAEAQTDATLRKDAADLRAEAADLRNMLARVEASWSFRLGRVLTAPGRWLRRLAGRG